MSHAMSGLCIDSEMDDIVPDDSISRGGISNRSDDSQNQMVLSTTASTIQTSKNTRPDERPKKSVLIFVKDDKYESNIEYLKGLMGVFQTSSEANRRNHSIGS